MARSKGPNAAVLLALKKGKASNEGAQPDEVSQKRAEDCAVALTESVDGGPRSAARHLAETSQAIRNTSEKVADLSNKRSGPNRIDRGWDSNGDGYLHLVFARNKLPDQVIDASFLLGLPNLAEPFAEGVLNHLEGVASGTRYNRLGWIRRGLVAFLLRHQPNANLGDLDRTTLVSYVKWQDSPVASAKGDATLAATSSRQLVGEARTMFQGLLKYPHWGAIAARILDDFPQRTHKGSQKYSQPREILPREVLQATYDAALQEIEEINHRLDHGERLLADGRRQLESGCRDYKLLSVALAALVDRYPGVFPLGKELLSEDPQLGWWVYQGARKTHGLARLASYRYAFSRDLVPFALLLAIEGAYNPDTVLGLQRSGIKERVLFGVSVTEVEGPKRRGGSGRYAKDFDTKVVNPWLQLLARLTEPLRSFLPEKDRDRLFVFSPATRTELGRAKAYYSNGGCSADVTWGKALANFQKRHGLPHFALAQIRPTLLDLVGQRHGALVATHAGRHKNFQTTEGHYLGPGTRARERERLGETLQQMERFLGTEGKVDVRRSARSPGEDKGAATPGFDCDDPYDSPVPGQRKNRLCRAYGMCPACPMATASPNDYRSVAQWLALGSAINRARDNLDPQHWLQKWAPMAVRLVELINQVPDNVLAKARTFALELPPVG